MNASDRQVPPDQPVTYAIQVQGKLKEEWSGWFNGMAITFDRAGKFGPVTTLVGPIADQSALRGVLTRIWNLNLNLISVTRLEPAKEKPAEVQGSKEGWK